MEEQAQSQEVREGENTEHENQSRGTASQRVPHLEREMDQMRMAMDEIRENIRRKNPVDDLSHRTNSPLVASIIVIPCLPSSRCLPWTRMMERATRVTILQSSRL